MSEKITEKAPCVIYARVSSSGYQADRQDTTRQFVDLRQVAEKKNYAVVSEFEEKVSGASKSKPIRDSCFAYCLENKVKAILVSEMSRLSRNTYDLLDVVKYARDNGINIIFHKENLSIFDEKGNESPLLPILVACMGFVAQLERDNIKFRLDSGKRNYLANGGKIGRKKGIGNNEAKEREKYKDVLTYLRKGYSIEVTAKATNHSKTTILKLKKKYVDGKK